MDCAFCSDASIKEREIIRTDLVCAFPTNIPIVPMHTLVAPVRHVERLEELTREEFEALFSLALQLAALFQQKFGAEGYHLAVNTGAVAGQSVPHLHLHVVPRKAGDAGITQYDPREFLYRPGSREKKPEDELRSVADEIRAAL